MYHVVRTLENIRLAKGEDVVPRGLYVTSDERFVERQTVVDVLMITRDLEEALESYPDAEAFSLVVESEPEPEPEVSESEEEIEDVSIDDIKKLIEEEDLETESEE